MEKAGSYPAISLLVCVVALLSPPVVAADQDSEWLLERLREKGFQLLGILHAGWEVP